MQPEINDYDSQLRNMCKYESLAMVQTRGRYAAADKKWIKFNNYEEKYVKFYDYKMKK